MKAARGRFTFVNTTAGPTNTSSSRVTPAQIEVCPWMRQRSPIFAPSATNENAPMTAPRPTDAPFATIAEE
jgi:hypothetical protein